MCFKIGLMLLLSFLWSFSYAIQTSKYQTESVPLVQFTNNATKDPIILNTQVDDIQQLDPRLKSVIMYAHYESIPVHINYFSSSSQRYATKVLELFKSNMVNSVNLTLVSSNNLIDNNLIKIYLEESNSVKPE